MKSLMKSGFMSLVLLLSFIAFAGEGDVAKVIILKGKVKAKLKSNKVIELKKGDWLPEGASVKTEAKSFVKLLFIDKSQMNLGPNSQMIINKFPKKKAGIITLMKGQLRSKVTKDYMQMDRSKEKLYIKTKTAAMGVRGTDFEVSVHGGQTHTNLYEGKLVVTTISPNMSPTAVQQMFTRPSALTAIGAGQMAVFKGDKAPPAVVKIPDNVMKEAAKSGGKGGDLKTLSDKTVRAAGGNNLLLPGTQKEDVANNSAGEDSGVVADGGPVIVDENAEKKEGEADDPMLAGGPGAPTDGDPNSPEGDPNAPKDEDGRAPADDGSGPMPTDDGAVAGDDSMGPPPGDCPLSGCGGIQGETMDPMMDPMIAGGPMPASADEGVYLEDPCVMDPSLCEVVPEQGDICMLNPELVQCGGGATSTNVQFNFSTQ